jgi:hypothetical protein
LGGKVKKVKFPASSLEKKKKKKEEMMQHEKRCLPQPKTTS